MSNLASKIVRVLVHVTRKMFRRLANQETIVAITVLIATSARSFNRQVGILPELHHLKRIAAGLRACDSILGPIVTLFNVVHLNFNGSLVCRLPPLNERTRMPRMSTGSEASSQTVTAKALRVAAVVALALLFWELASILLMAFAGVLAAIFFRSLGIWVSQRTGLSRRWSVAIVLVVLGVLSAAGVFLSGDPVAKQMTELTDQIPRSLEKIKADLEKVEWGKWLVQKAPESAEDLPVSGKDMASYASDALTSVTGGLVAAFIVLILSLYLSFDPTTYTDGAIRLFPVGKRDRIRSVLKEVHQALQMWLLGKILSMLVVGVLTTIGLGLIGVPLSLALGVIAALLTFIPNFGPILSAVPAVLLAFVDSPMMALYVVLLYLAIQIVESYLITPLIQQRTVSLPPALTIFTQIGFGILFGAAGVVLATPLTAGALVLIKRLYVEDGLETEDHR